MTGTIAPLAFTPGEPAGIGPDLAVLLARAGLERPWVAVADPAVLADRARRLGVAVRLREYEPGSPAPAEAGQLWVLPVPAEAPVSAGSLDPRNAPYVLRTLDRAVTGCLAGELAALVTGPVHKGVINDAGIPFTGHTELLAERTGTPRVVMLLAAGTLRVALVTTHIPLSAVPRHITPERVEGVLRILVGGLEERFAIPGPVVRVLGLNPHAGEGGHLGREELEVIAPVLERLRGEGLRLEGPVPADTAFNPADLAGVDAVLAMYHDQGLPVLKHAGFGQAVNVTLGLPFVRTSVDHGTALDLAGTGRAGAGSARAAMDLAARMAVTAPARSGG